MDKETWRKNWLNSINELTTLELQKNSWLNSENKNPHWSYIEFLSCYFDDLEISENYTDELNINLISQQEYEIIKDWHNRLNKYEEPNNDSYNHKLILEDSKWYEIVEIGKNAKRQLSQILNLQERELLEKNKNVV